MPFSFLVERFADFFVVARFLVAMFSPLEGDVGHIGQVNVISRNTPEN